MFLDNPYYKIFFPEINLNTGAQIDTEYSSGSVASNYSNNVMKSDAIKTVVVVVIVAVVEYILIKK